MVDFDNLWHSKPEATAAGASERPANNLLSVSSERSANSQLSAGTELSANLVSNAGTDGSMSNSGGPTTPIEPVSGPARERHRAGVVSQFTDAALHAALQAPANGITQAIDGIAGTNLHDRVKNNEWFAAPQEEKFGSLDWHVQQLGTAVGVAADFIVLNKGLKGLASGLSGLKAVGNSGIPARALSTFVSKPMVSATVAGGIYDGLFRESAGSENLLGSRLKQAGIGAATFATLSGTSSLLRSATASGVVGRGVTSRVLGSQTASGFLSGIPAGIVSAELSSGGQASFEDLYKSAYGFAFVGGTIGSAGSLANKVASRSTAGDIQGANHKPSEAPATNGRASSSSLSGGLEHGAKRTGAAGPQHLADSDLHVNQSFKIDYSDNVKLTRPGLHEGTQSVSVNGAMADVHPIFKMTSSFRDRLQNTAFHLGITAPMLKIQNVIDKWWGNSSLPQGNRDTEVTLFLEGGGANGWRHIGVLRAMEELNLKIGDIYTASVGTVIGALAVKGKNSFEIESHFHSEFQSPLVQATLPKGPGLRAFINRADPTAMIQSWVEKYGLEPHDRLHIGTFVPRERRLHWFEGKDYDIAEAIKASMNIPGVFQLHKFSRESLGMGEGKRVTLLDGGIRRVTADDLPHIKPIVISRLNTPEAFQYNSVNNRFLNWLGKKLDKPLHRNLDAPDGDAVVIYPKEGQVNSMAFNQTESVNKALIKDGYETAKAALTQALKEGRLASSAPIITYQLGGGAWTGMGEYPVVLSPKLER
jgi:hypothetical protein